MMRISTVLFFMLVLVAFAYGQPAVTPPPDGPPDNGGAPVPITGIEWLIGSGVILGARLMTKLKKK